MLPKFCRLRWSRWLAHDAPDRGARATGGARPARARRSPPYVGSGLKASLAMGPKQRRMSGSAPLADVMMRDGGIRRSAIGGLPHPVGARQQLLQHRDPRLTPV